MSAIFKKELKLYFATPIGYAFAAIFLISSGFFFWLFTLYGGSGSYVNFFLVQMFSFIILIPVLTMKLMSEEQKMKTDIVILTAPISLAQIVIGKFLAALTLFTSTFLVSCLPCFLLYSYSGADSAPNTAAIITAMLGSIFVAAAFIAIGLFISSLTENQLIAAIVTIFVLLFFLLIQALASIIPVYAIRVVFDWFSFYSRYETFTNNILSVESIVYFVSISVVFIFLTVRVCETRRWK